MARGAGPAPAGLRTQELLVRLVGVAGAVPGVGLLAVAVGDAVEAVEQAAVVRVQAARPLGDQPLPVGSNRW